jgi:hypothetical protein
LFPHKQIRPTEIVSLSETSFLHSLISQCWIKCESHTFLNIIQSKETSKLWVTYITIGEVKT